MDYLQVDVGIGGELMTGRFARLLGCSTHEAVGWLVAFWSGCARCRRVRESGSVGKDAEAPEIEALAGWPLERAGKLAEALRLEKYVRRDGSIAGWKTRYGAYLRTRDMNRARQRKHRAKKSEAEDEEGLPLGRVTRDVTPVVTRDKRDGHVSDETRREQTRQEEMKTSVPSNSLSPSPSRPSPSPRGAGGMSFFASVTSRKDSEQLSAQLLTIVRQDGVLAMQLASEAITVMAARSVVKKGGWLRKWLDAGAPAAWLIGSGSAAARDVEAAQAADSAAAVEKLTREMGSK